MAIDAGERATWPAQFRRLGLRISIDDFGSGHSGLALLEHYDCGSVSLSMSMVRGIESSRPRQAIVCGLLQTCGDLGIDIVAKGVETKSEREWLNGEGIELLQGFCFTLPAFGQLPEPALAGC